MMKRLIPFCIISLFLAACAPINTQFSCNETAGDRCLSIEEVNAMTEAADSRVGHAKPIAGRNGRSSDNTRAIWVAPWIDKQGVKHKNDVLFASIEKNNSLS